MIISNRSELITNTTQCYSSSRPDATVSCPGVAAYGNNNYYVDGEHNEPHEHQLDSYPLTIANATEQ